jgi:hypothetical protein
MAGTYQQAWVYTDVSNISILVITSLGSICSALRADIRGAAALSVSRGRWDDAAAFERFYTRKIVYDFLNAMGDTIDAASDRFFGSMTRVRPCTRQRARRILMNHARAAEALTQRSRRAAAAPTRQHVSLCARRAPAAAGSEVCAWETPP